MKKKKLEGDLFKYAVDIPNADLSEWICIDYFETRKKAIHFAQTNFGADKNGNINLINSL